MLFESKEAPPGFGLDDLDRQQVGPELRAPTLAGVHRVAKHVANRGAQPPKLLVANRSGPDPDDDDALHLYRRAIAQNDSELPGRIGGRPCVIAEIRKNSWNPLGITTLAAAKMHADEIETDAALVRRGHHGVHEIRRTPGILHPARLVRAGLQMHQVRRLAMALLDELALQERPRGVTVDHDDGRPASFVDVVQIALRDLATV